MGYFVFVKEKKNESTVIILPEEVNDTSSRVWSR